MLRTDVSRERAACPALHVADAFTGGAEPRGGSLCARAPRGDDAADRAHSIWSRAAAGGVPYAAAQGSRFRAPRDPRAPREGRQKPRGSVELPTALVRKAHGWAVVLAWQWVFPASRRYRDAESGVERRHHVHETVMQRAMQHARSVRRGSRSARPATRSGISSRLTCWRTGTTSGRCRSFWGTRM